MSEVPHTPQPRPKAELGCWTFVIIAIIVMLFSDSGDNRKLRRRIDELGARVEKLEKKIDTLIELQKPAPKPAAPATTTTATTTAATTT